MILDELKILDSINLDFSNNTIKTINAKQTDTESRYVSVTCTDHGKKVVLNHETVGALIVCKKPDNFYVLNRCTVSEEGTVLIQLTQQMLAVSGKAVAELILFSGVLDNNVDISGLLVSDDGAGNVTIDGTNDVVQTLHNLGVSVLTTMSFYINILPSVISDSEIESSYEFNALVDGLSTQFAIEQQMKALEDSIKVAEELRVEEENNRDTAEADRERAENDRTQTFNNAITNAEAATEKANTAYENADVAAKDASAAAENATTKMNEMQTLMDRFNQAVSGVIQDNESSNMTTYSSEKINSVVSNFSNPNLLINEKFMIYDNYNYDYNCGDWIFLEPNESTSVFSQWIVENTTNHGMLIKADSQGLNMFYYDLPEFDENGNHLEYYGNVCIYQELNDDFLSQYNGKNYVLTTSTEFFNEDINDYEIIVNTYNGTINRVDNNIVRIELTPTYYKNEETDDVIQMDDMYVNYVKLEISNTATPYIPRTIEEEYTLCDIYMKRHVIFLKDNIYLGALKNICHDNYYYMTICLELPTLLRPYTVLHPDVYDDNNNKINTIYLHYSQTHENETTNYDYIISNNQLLIRLLDGYNNSSFEDCAIGVSFNSDWYINY